MDFLLRQLEAGKSETLTAYLAAMAQFAALIVGLDRFRAVNDELGHYAGDCLLDSVAMRLRSCVGDRGLLGRLDGDELLLPCPNLRTAARPALADDLLRALRQPFSVDGQEIYAGASIGIGMFPTNGDSCFGCGAA